jgi:hypothetical protein
MAKKKASKNIPLPILIIICAVLLFAIYLRLSTLALAIWGDSVMGTVDSYQARLDDTKAEQNRSRTVSKGYWFMANGKEYRGYVLYYSDEAWPSLDEGETRSERIRYIALFPYINKPTTLCEFDEMGEVAIIYHTLAPIGYLLLLLLVIRTARGRKKKKTAARKPAAPQIIEARSDTDTLKILHHLHGPPAVVCNLADIVFFAELFNKACPPDNHSMGYIFSNECAFSTSESQLCEVCSRK